VAWWKEAHPGSDFDFRYQSPTFGPPIAYPLLMPRPR